MIWLSIVVVVVIAIAVVAGVFLRSRRGRGPGQIVVSQPGDGRWWIYWGVGISTIVLFGFVGWTVSTIAAIARPPAASAFTVDVSARQWWWGFSYGGSRGREAFATANELHIPVGEPVRLDLSSPDVIHSFWVPMLGGKTDVIPGRVNRMWLEADKPGVYRGQCSEFCGRQHAKMALYVVAEPRAQFEVWLASQQAAAVTPATGALRIGHNRFVDRCGKCHTVRGTLAKGEKGPDLTHVMSRSTLAAGTLPNNVGNLAGWIAHPQGIKPDALMPDIDLSGPELQSIVAYVATLR
ncbi:MAG: cytochrome c oxidase subunit II [Acidobacteriaceae bacterium]